MMNKKVEKLRRAEEILGVEKKARQQAESRIVALLEEPRKERKRAEWEVLKQLQVEKKARVEVETRIALLREENQRNKIAKKNAEREMIRMQNLAKAG